MPETQRQIGEQRRAADPQPRAASLKGYTVAEVTRAMAADIILQYEWLKSLGGAHIFIGLMSPTGDLAGAACFGYGPPAGSPELGTLRKLIGEPALCLERGACAHDTPQNAASFLITRACKLVHGLTGTARFFAYCDPSAGEYGGVYQAANWLYLGQGLHGKRKNRPMRDMWLPPGGDPDNPADWHSTRIFRQQNQHLYYDTAREAGWTKGKRPSKHIYATHIGSSRQRRRWIEAITTELATRDKKFIRVVNGIAPYPAPAPDLKRRSSEI
jgi:hypothetical protein